MVEVDIIGGGLAGLAAATVLAQSGARVVVYEKKKYPCVKLCGEFLSPEGLSALAMLAGKTRDSVARELSARSLSRFAWVSRQGRVLELDLDPGGWAVRRDVLDPWLARLASEAGAEVFFGKVGDSSGSRTKLWATGKERDGLKSRYFAVKGYARDLHGQDALAGRDVVLFQLSAGYVGFSRMSGGELSYCALLDRKRVDPSWRFIGWEHLSKGVFTTNSSLIKLAATIESGSHNHVASARFDFRARPAVRNGEWFAGDAVQLVPPFVGDGMAMAIEGGALAARAMLDRYSDNDYQRAWRQKFGGRLFVSRCLHPLLWLGRAHEPVIVALGRMPRLARWIYSRTRGSSGAYCSS